MMPWLWLIIHQFKCIKYSIDLWAAFFAAARHYACFFCFSHACPRAQALSGTLLVRLFRWRWKCNFQESPQILMSEENVTNNIDYVREKHVFQIIFKLFESIGLWHLGKVPIFIPKTCLHIAQCLFLNHSRLLTV